MFLLAFFTVSMYIMVRDFLTHRISNVSILLLSSILLLDPHQSEMGMMIIAILIVSILFYILKMGMGDLKLMAGLLITQGALIISIRYLTLLICVLLITLITQLFLHRTLQASVAFAHVLLLPFLIGYLAI